MNVDKKVLGYFVPLFVAGASGFLLYVGQYGYAAGILVVFIALVLGVDKIKISKSGIQIEDKNEPKA